VLDDFGGQNTPTKWEPLSQTKFMSFVNAISIRLGNSGVWLFGKKNVDLSLKIIEMFFCAREAKLSAKKISNALGDMAKKNSDPALCTGKRAWQATAPRVDS
jgi:hypothetical protein